MYRTPKFKEALQACRWHACWWQFFAHGGRPNLSARQNAGFAKLHLRWAKDERDTKNREEAECRRHQ